MGAPDSGFQGIEQGAAESLLSSFKTIDPAERRKHATVLNYWLSIRGEREFPPLHDLDPLELSDAGPTSLLLELIGGGHDAEIRHLGDELKGEVTADRLIDAASPSLLASIAKKLPIVALSRDFLAFEDQFSTANGVYRYWVTLLPLSACGNWVDYVYALVSFKTPGGAEAPAEAVAEEIIETVEQQVEVEAVEPESVELAEPEPEPEAEAVAEPVDEPEPEPEVAVAEEQPVEAVVEVESQPEETVAEADPPTEPVAEVEPPVDAVAETIAEDNDEPARSGKPGFSKIFDSIAGLAGFYGQGVKVDPDLPPAEEFVEEEPVAEAEPPLEDIAEAEPVADADPAVEEITIEEPVVEAEPVADEAVVAEEPVAELEQPDVEPVAEAAPADVESPTPVMEGSLQSKLEEVRVKADEARQAKLRANAALYEGLSAAYDFALDAEDSPEEYLRLVEAQGLKIQLRSPMKPVVKLAFDGMCDDATVKQLEAVLAWAFQEELPRGTLAERIEAAGGIAHILNS